MHIAKAAEENLNDVSSRRPTLQHAASQPQVAISASRPEVRIFGRDSSSLPPASTRRCRGKAAFPTHGSSAPPSPEHALAVSDGSSSGRWGARCSGTARSGDGGGGFPPRAGAGRAAPPYWLLSCLSSGGSGGGGSSNNSGGDESAAAWGARRP